MVEWAEGDFSTVSPQRYPSELKPSKTIFRKKTMKSRLIKGCLLAFLVLSLIGCGGTGQAEGANVPNMLHIVRNPVPSYQFAPIDMVIHNAAQVQDLYNAANALAKTVRQGPYNCPEDNGLEYHLDFLYGTTSIRQMELDATGCQMLDLNAAGFALLGINTHDVRFTTPAFRALLTKILNLPSLSPTVY